MSAEEIRAKVVEVARKYARMGVPINDDSKLELDLGLDWMDKVELVMDVEEEIGTPIDDYDVDNAKTVGDIVKAAQKRRREVKLKKISAQSAERRTCFVEDLTSEHGRSKAIVECPFCGRRNIVYKWSLAGSGKRCTNETCRAHLCWGVAIKDMVPTESEVEA